MADEGKKPETTGTQEPVEAGFKTVVENGHEYVVNEATGAKFFAGDYVEKVRAEAEANRKKLAEIQEAQDAERQKKLEEQGEYKQLVEEAKTKQEELKKELEAAQARLTAIDEERENARKELLAKLPKEKQELYADASHTIIQDVLDTLKIDGAPNHDPGKPKLTTPPADLENLTPFERMRMGREQ
jgi:molecular chaperone GrpE (heat shock protein)